jgi:hypothetical protein
MRAIRNASVAPRFRRAALQSADAVSSNRFGTMFGTIGRELRVHAPFTLIGALGLLLLCMSLHGQLATAAERGTLRGRVIYAGKAPPQKRLDITADKVFCEKFHPVDESLIVAKDGGLANVVVAIRVKRGRAVALPANYQDRVQQPVVLDNPECRFDPHVLKVLAGQTLVIKNPDPIGQAAKVECIRNPSINVMIPTGAELKVVFALAEPRPVPVSCSIHPWESAHLVVRSDPYMAVSAKGGTFEIKDIPIGTHEFQFWHERVGYLKDARLEGGATDRRGRVKIAIRNGIKDLGRIKVSPALLDRK